MQTILYFFRDKIVGVHYFMYAFVCILLVFSIIGYLAKLKYGKVQIKLNSSQPSKQEEPKVISKEQVVTNQQSPIQLPKQDNLPIPEIK